MKTVVTYFLSGGFLFITAEANSLVIFNGLALISVIFACYLLQICARMSQSFVKT